MNHPSLTGRIFLQVLKRARHGSVHVTFPDGKKETFGEGGPVICADVRAWSVFGLLFAKGDLGLAEAIISGDLVVEDPAALVEWACRNDQSLARALHGTWYGVVASQLKRWVTINDRRGAKRNIMAHYDLGNDFYRLWLDPSMTYSSGIYEAASTELAVAQQAKYDRLIEGLNLKSSDHVLEIGCGWGGFFSRAVEKTGCKVTAVMNSPSQAAHNRELIARQGMKGHVDLREMDYRDIDGRFDKIVSIEMIEAVGEKYWGAFFGKVGASLKAKGTAMIQGITIREEFFDSYRRQTDFIQQYVFPGGMLLTNEVFRKQGNDHHMRLEDQFEFGLSYARTLRQWRDNFQARRAEVLAMGFDEAFMRMWDLYLAYCEGAFRSGRINVGQFRFERAGNL